MARKKDAISLLKEDHDKVRKLLSELEDTTEEDTDTREDLMRCCERLARDRCRGRDHARERHERGAHRRHDQLERRRAHRRHARERE